MCDARIAERLKEELIIGEPGTITGLKIRAAFPAVFKRAYPALDPKTEMLPAVSLLRFHEIDALPLAFGADKHQRRRAVFGFSCLAKLRQMGPAEFGEFLKRPCEEASEELSTIDADEDVRDLLRVFSTTHFGFAMVENRHEEGGLITLADVLGLYDTGVIRSHLVVGDVASPIFSMPGKTRLKEVLREMYERAYRRVFISGSRVFVSDRAIITHVFSPAVLTRLARGSSDVLDTPLSAIERSEPRSVPVDTSLKQAASTLTAMRGQTLVCEKGVVTPWDVVMKPWRAKALGIRK